ncbi:hypothetical protein ACFL2O_07900 [Thermodesulfobacteriota bacterium]
MLNLFKRIKKQTQTKEVEVIYGFDTTHIEHLLETLEPVLKCRLYSHISPMIGPWYSSHDLDSVQEMLREGHIDEAEQVAAKIEAHGIPNVEIVLNDPDPYRGGPEFPNGFVYLLKVSANPEMVNEIDDRLSKSDLEFKKLR